MTAASRPHAPFAAVPSEHRARTCYPRLGERLRLGAPEASRRDAPPSDIGSDLGRWPGCGAGAAIPRRWRPRRRPPRAGRPPGQSRTSGAWTESLRESRECAHLEGERRLFSMRLAVSARAARRAPQDVGVGRARTRPRPSGPWSRRVRCGRPPGPSAPWRHGRRSPSCAAGRSAGRAACGSAAS